MSLHLIDEPQGNIREDVKIRMMAHVIHLYMVMDSLAFNYIDYDYDDLPNELTDSSGIDIDYISSYCMSI